MPDTSPSQEQFLKDLDKSRAERDRLPQAARRESAAALFNRRTAADKLRANLDAAVYKHAVLGLIFLKYVSDSFTARQKEIEAQLRGWESEPSGARPTAEGSPQGERGGVHQYFLDTADYGTAESPEHKEAIREELEELLA